MINKDSSIRFNSNIPSRDTTAHTFNNMSPTPRCVWSIPLAGLSGLMTRGPSNMEDYSLITVCVSHEPDYIRNESSYATNTASQPKLSAERVTELYRCFMRAAVRASPHTRGVGGRPERKEQDKPNKRELKGAYASPGDKCKGNSGQCYTVEISPTLQSVPAIHTRTAT